MKKIFGIISVVLMCVLVGASVWCCSDDDDKNDITVGYDQLPQDAKVFISEYYEGVSVSRIEKDIDFEDIEFVVYLSNGHEVTFNSHGEWNDVEAPMGQTVPAGIVPAAIADYVAVNYPDWGINEISKNAAGYEVELTDGLDLSFDTAGNFVDYGRR